MIDGGWSHLFVTANKRQKRTGGTSGITTSWAFTPVQGLELPVEEREARVKAANDKYGGGGGIAAALSLVNTVVLPN